MADGHDQLAARVRWRPVGSDEWLVSPLQDTATAGGKARSRRPRSARTSSSIDAWTDRYATWRHEIDVKVAAGQDVELELEEGALLLEDLAAKRPRPAERDRLQAAATAIRRTSCTLEVRLDAAADDEVVALVSTLPDTRLSSSGPHPLWVDRPAAAHAAWYELFPRSFGGFRGTAEHLPYVADLGFDVVYLPPIHPIGAHASQGPRQHPDPVGRRSRAARGRSASAEGGHDAVDPDARHAWRTSTPSSPRPPSSASRSRSTTRCSAAPTTPGCADHPEWFTQRPDGSIRYAENPPKKYQDIHPINFWPAKDADRIALWAACRDILEHWIAHGVRTFRVDNPHTKPLPFWAWVIADVQSRHPDVVFLAEAFTDPAMMAKLAEVGFTQSYTYFTWRHDAWELREYVTELTQTPLVDYMRPSFWPNTPGHPRRPPPPRPARRVSRCGSCSPPPSCRSTASTPATSCRERACQRHHHRVPPLGEVRDQGARLHAAALARAAVRSVNEIRRRHPGVWSLPDIRFHHSDDERFLVYSRGHADTDLLLVVVNLEPHQALDTTVRLDLGAVGLPADHPYTLHDELSGDTYVWGGPSAYVRLDAPAGQVAHLFHVTR